ncbi:MAG TPA: quinone-dependent dihydroorotate dehydrogenase [Steroidobacteraceae bacterium]|jgi:dihydroorotate dehydrogenase|nr:quinone-dependent dihydroorotate dehydrogenase [Steroidobacteraceae bacterium]
MWYRAIRPALFALDPERAHQLALDALRLAGRRTPRLPSTTTIECMGLRFPNRVGLAAGFDKNAVAIDGLGALGFGFIEVGTVTPRAQAGQARPRLFRLPAAGALINRLGFPNDGAESVAARLRRRRYPGIVGVNIGKNATTSIAHAVDDYVSCLRIVRNVADYVVVNVSSPNTARLRELQTAERLKPLLCALLHERACGPREARHRLPLLLKIAPDLPPAELPCIAGLLKSLPMDGVVATNTTTRRHGTALAANRQAGGLSGRPLRSIALNVVVELRAHLGPDFPIIGVGGIDSPHSALDMLVAGANLVQLYTGLIYRGPTLVSQIVRALDVR